MSDTRNYPGRINGGRVKAGAVATPFIRYELTLLRFLHKAVPGTFCLRCPAPFAWNVSSNHLRRGGLGGPEKVIWGQLGRALALASAFLVVGSFANLSGLTELIFGRPLFIGLGAGE